MVKYVDETEITIDLNTVDLEQLLMSIGGVLFAGAEVFEIETPLFSRLDELIRAELILRENGMDMPTDERRH